MRVKRCRTGFSGCWSSRVDSQAMGNGFADDRDCIRKAEKPAEDGRDCIWKAEKLAEDGKMEIERKEGGTAAGGREEMPRVDEICAHPLWRESVKKIRELEKTRIFCGHNPAHFLDVARLAQLENLEWGLGLKKEMIYAAALLHDIGRHLQYEQGIPHDQGSRMLAERILPDCGFSEEEQAEILEAVGAHRKAPTGELESLAGVIYRADKRSRMCLFCEAEPECDWPEEKKNRRIGG